MKSVELTPRFVESIPEALDEGVLYVSMTFATTIHLCACGCGREAVAPLSPTDWKLCFDGEHVTLDPSIGNWSFPCRSHYWVRNNRIRWAASMSVEEISDLRALDRARKASLLWEESHSSDATQEPTLPSAKDHHITRPSPLGSIWNWLLSRSRKNSPL